MAQSAPPGYRQGTAREGDQSISTTALVNAAIDRKTRSPLWWSGFFCLQLIAWWRSAYNVIGSLQLNRSTVQTTRRGTMGNTKHTCNDGDGPYFGRLDTTGECPRCAELKNGASPRAWGRARWDRGVRRTWPFDRDADIRTHFRRDPVTGDCPHDHCGPISTCFDW